MLRDHLVKMRVPKLLDAFSRRYFQLEVLHPERLKLKANQPALLVMNHTAFFAMECYLIGSHILSQNPNIDLRTLVWKGFSEGPAGLWFRNIGCETASISRGKQLLSEGKTVLIMPEGVGATDVRNRLNHFHSGYLRILQTENVPVIPIGFHGIDQSIPWYVGYHRYLEEKLMKPVDPNFDFLLFPKLPAPRPTKVVFNVGEAIHVPPHALDTEQGVNFWNKVIKNKISDLMDDAEQHRHSQVNKTWSNRLFHQLVEGSITQLNPRRPS